VRKLGLRLPSLVDSLANHVERAYTGWPDRIYVIEQGGRIAYKSPPGPYGFSSAELERQLQRLTGRRS
jgi:type I thyroxine 5'-deiodinase